MACEGDPQMATLSELSSSWEESGEEVKARLRQLSPTSQRSSLEDFPRSKLQKFAKTCGVKVGVEPELYNLLELQSPCTRDVPASQHMYCRPLENQQQSWTELWRSYRQVGCPALQAKFRTQLTCIWPSIIGRA